MYWNTPLRSVGRRLRFLFWTGFIRRSSISIKSSHSLVFLLCYHFHYTPIKFPNLQFERRGKNPRLKSVPCNDEHRYASTKPTSILYTTFNKYQWTLMTTIVKTSSAQMFPGRQPLNHQSAVRYSAVTASCAYIHRGWRAAAYMTWTGLFSDSRCPRTNVFLFIFCQRLTHIHFILFNKTP